MHEYKIFTKGKNIEKASKALILLHGRGATAQDILTLSDFFASDEFYVVAPQATNYTWYPYSFMAKESQNEPWLSSAVEVVKRLIDETNQHIPLENIYLMGFSQGACLTLEVTSRFAQKYAGIAAFIGGLVGDKLVRERYQGHFMGTKAVIINSNADPHVPLIRSEESKKIMEELGANVKLQVYNNMPHTVTQQAIDIVKKELF
jgi:phospholipase/carboxylesterase